MKAPGVFLSLGAGVSAFALAYLMLGMPGGLYPRSDDFAYLRTIVGSLERGGPFLHFHLYEWLAPYSAVMTAAGAMGWNLTGNLPLAALGFMAASSLAAFVLLFRLLSVRVAPGWASALALAFAMSPTFFAKASDFHGAIPTFALFLAALVFHEERKAGLFHLAAFLAFVNRQSHLVLLVLPMLQAAAVVARGRAFPLRLAAWFGLFGAGALTLSFGMNRTYAQIHAVFIGAGVLDRARATVLALAAGLFIALALLAVFSAPWRPVRDILSGNLRRPARPLIASVLLLAAAWFWPPDLIRTDFPLFGLVGGTTLNRALPWILLPALWILDYGLLRPSPYLALAAAFLLVGSLRGIWWDYYFLEIAALCLLIAVDRAEGPGPGLPARAVLGLFIFGCLGYGYLLKIESDRQALAVKILERLEREERVSVDAMTNAPFGYLGWKLFDHFIAHEGRTFTGLHDFLGYVRRDRVKVETQVPWRRAYREPLPARAELLEAGRVRVGFAMVEYRVADWHGPDSARSIGGRPMALDHASYLPAIFPLDREEWNALRAGRLPP